MNQIPITKGAGQRGVCVLYALRTKANAAMCTLIPYDLILYRSELSVFRPWGVDGGFCLKGYPPREVSQGRQGWGGFVSGLLCAMAAFCDWDFPCLGSKFVSFIYLFFQKKQREAPEIHVSIKRKPGKREKSKQKTKYTQERVDIPSAGLRRES